MWQRVRRHRQRQQHRSKKWTRADGRWSVWTQAARASVKTTARLTYPPLLAHNTHTKQVRDTDRGRQKKVMQSVLDQLKPAAQFSLNKSFYSKDITWNQMFLKANRKKLTETRCLSGSNVPFLRVLWLKSHYLAVLLHAVVVLHFKWILEVSFTQHISFSVFRRSIQKCLC